MSQMRTHLPVLLLDFDGTVCVGDAPVHAYADAVLDGLPTEITTPIRTTLDDFLAGRLGPRWEDAYEAVHKMSAPHVSREDLDRAYVRSRERLQDGELPVGTPDGLVDFLASLDGVARRVLVTNAPLEGVAGTLERLGLDPVLDGVFPGAGKPTGWPSVLPTILGDRPASLAVSVGDVYGNDIAPLIPLGAATALISRFGPEDTPAAPTWAAASFPDLYPALSQWLHCARSEGH